MITAKTTFGKGARRWGVDREHIEDFLIKIAACCSGGKAPNLNFDCKGSAFGRTAFKHFVFGTPPRGYQGSGAFKPPLYVQLSLFFLDLFMNCDFSSRHKFPEAITYHLGRDL